MSSSPSSSLDGTHIRERHSSSNSSSSRLPPPHSATNPTTLPISLDALLAQHANAPNSHLAALDQALSERNIFSTQNTQLWKLIEKQRTAYNQVLKELERMRAERDAYKACLQAAGLSAELAKKDKPKSLRPSASNATMATSSENRTLDPRAPMVRHFSDTSGVCSSPCNPSFAKTTASGSRGDDRPLTPPRPQELNGRDLQVPHSNGSPDVSLLPAIALPRSMSLSRGNSNTSSTPLPSSSSAENPYARVPLDANELSGSRSQPPSVQHTPNAMISPPSPYSTTVSSTPGSHPASLIPHSSIPGTGLLSPIPEHSKPISRDSNVSLPDEARRYIANLASPLQSPGLTTAMPSSDPTYTHKGQGVNTGKLSPTKLWRTGSRSGDESDFLEIDEEGDQAEETEGPQSLVVNRHDTLVDTDDFPTPPSHGPTHVHPPGYTQGASSQPAPNPGTHLPPTPEADVASQGHWQSQSDISITSQSQSSAESTPLTPQPDSPFPESYLSPTKSTLGISGDGCNPTFRSLPLIAGDLKTTRVMVSHSSIRPNDRGKEVLSFEIEVDPGKSKEPWKIEKLYSDVLGLDHRLRAAVGRSVSKKIASLPEGKLWRDHAPAKSDQRKVCKSHS